MAAPIYTTDLIDIYTDSGTGSMSLISSGGGGQSAITEPETDDYIQGASSVSRNGWSSSIRGIVYTATAALPVTAGNAVFIWTKADISQALATKAAGGIQALVGNSSTALNAFYTDGNDSYTFGGWKCYPIDPTVTPNTTIGTPTTTTQVFGVRWNIPAAGPSKGFPFKIDAIRRGRTLIVTDGDLANGYSTFSGASSFQGNITRQWGLFQSQNGTFLHQGLFRIGTGATLVDFRDSNKVIFIANTEFVGANFNGYEINNASSNVLWDNISISALGTVSRGNFVINNNPTVTWTGCTFNDVGTFSLGGSNTTVTETAFRRTGLITINGSVFTNNAITNSRAASSILATSLSNITGNTFTSDGSNHAVELSSIGGGSMSWNNQLNGYVTGASGSPATTSSTGNEAIYVNVASGTLTINVETGASIPSIRTAGAVVNVVAGQVTTTITVRDLSTGSVIEGANVYVTADAGGGLAEGTQIIKGLTNASGQISDTRGLGSDQPITGWVRKATGTPYYQQANIVGTISNATGLNVTVQMIRDQ